MKTLKVKFAFFSLLAMIAVSVFMTSCEQDAIISNVDEVSNPALDKQFKNYEIVEIDNDEVWTSVKNQISGEVNLDMRKATPADSPLADWSFNMNPQEVQAEDFKMYAVGKDGQLTEKTLPETHVLLGQFDNGTGEIFMGITQENFRASINQGEATYMLEPLSDYIKDAKANQYIKYNVADIINDGKNHGCGFDENSFEVQQTETANTSIDSRANWRVEISYLGDFDLYAYKFGYNFNAASSWMYWSIVYGGYRYAAYNGYPVDLIIKAGYLFNYNSPVATDIYNYTNFTYQWRDYGNSNTWWFNKGDANLLFTGKDVYGVAGAAQPQSICRWDAYGFVEYLPNSYQQQNVVAHEVGHILGANHTYDGFMRADGITSHTMGYVTRNELNYWLSWNNSCLY